MKKDDKHTKDRIDRKIRHPTAPSSMKTIIMNLIIAFFLYLLRRGIGQCALQGGQQLLNDSFFFLSSNLF